jgi:hypothetical protein
MSAERRSPEAPRRDEPGGADPYNRSGDDERMPVTGRKEPIEVFRKSRHAGKGHRERERRIRFEIEDDSRDGKANDEGGDPYNTVKRGP